MAIARLSPADLKTRLDGGDPVTLVDARLKYPYEHSSLTLPGAVRVTPWSSDLRSVSVTGDVVIYDSDPGEVVAEQLATRLAAVSGARLSVLAGGFNAWLAAGGSTASKPAVGQPLTTPDAPKT